MSSRKKCKAALEVVSVQRKSSVEAETKMLDGKNREMVTKVVMMPKKRWKSTFCGEKAVLFLSHVQHARCSLAVVRRVLSCFSDCATTDLPTASQRLRRALLLQCTRLSGDVVRRRATDGEYDCGENVLQVPDV